jgi:large subunit ribosomal protein L24
MMKIRRGDTVEVIAGNERGQRGTVRDVVRGWKVDRKRQRVGRDPRRDRVIVGGLNFIKKHQRPISQTRTQTGIIEREAPVHISNVALVCPHCDEWTRVGIDFVDGAKVRMCKRCKEVIE